MIKPEATSRFVDKVKGIPTTVSSRFHREKKTGIVINGDTTYSSGNFESNDDTSVNSNKTNKGKKDDDSLWLQEFNKEINGIMASGNDVENTTTVVEPEPDVIVEPEPDVIVEPEPDVIVEPEPDVIVEPEPDVIVEPDIIVEQESNTTNDKESTGNLAEIIGNVLDNGNNNQQNNSSNNSNTTQKPKQVNTSTILTEQQWGDCAEAGLTVQDCEDLVRDFGNYN